MFRIMLFIMSIFDFYRSGNFALYHFNPEKFEY
ncbi:MAG: hypothetical protein JWQ14_1471 [Adhaeribacter sp.]|nr:hypothetical protein [Adhaeribacter sp.]